MGACGRAAGTSTRAARRDDVVDQKQTATNFADRCIAYKFLANQGLQNPRTTNLMDKIPDHGAHFATGRLQVAKNRGSKLFETFSFL